LGARRYWPQWGENPEPRPIIGAIHLAAGYLISAILGCEIKYLPDSPPGVIPANMSDSEIENLKAPTLEKVPIMQELIEMMDVLENKYGYLQGDINWAGVQNVALDLRGQQLFLDYYENPELAKHLFEVISQTIINFTGYIRKRTGTTSLSVNRIVGQVNPDINLHSNCSVTMISRDMYEDFLLTYDNILSEKFQPYGIHHCGDNMEHFAPAYAKVKNISFFDVGWGSDIAECRKFLPDEFFSLRLSPNKLLNCQPDEIQADIHEMVRQNGGVKNAGLCCINMDHGTPDDNVRMIFDTAKELCGND